MKAVSNTRNETMPTSIVARRLNGVGEYYFSQKLREIEAMNKAGKQVINLGIGSPDMSPHPEVIKTLYEEALRPDQHGYQNYKGNIVLRNAIAQWYKKWYDVHLNPDTEILPLIGSKEGIMHICMTYINEGSLALIPNPGYPTYKSAATIAGATIQAYSLKEKNNWFPDFEELDQIISNHKNLSSGDGQILMFVNYPHMPTGQLPTPDLFIQLVAFAKKNDILICHDNPYSFILNENPMSMLGVEGAMDVVVELNSLSKSHNMAGWRVGILAGAKERIDNVIRFKSNMDSGMFLPVQLAAAKALTLGKEWFNEINKVYIKRREKVFELLDLLKCSFDKNQAGLFVWAGIPEDFEDSYALSDKILEQSNVFITPGAIFGSAGDKYVRVSLCSTEEKIDEAISRINTSAILDEGL
jgi:LL-diaminopimelate aminotransferase